MKTCPLKPGVCCKATRSLAIAGRCADCPNLPQYDSVEVRKVVLTG